MRGRKSRTYHCCSAASSPTHVLFSLRRSIVSVAPFVLFLSRLLAKMIDIIQWRVSIGLWNCCQSAAGPIRRGCRSIKTESRSPNAKNKTRSLLLSLITVLLFVLTLISGYLEIKYNPPLRGIIWMFCGWVWCHVCLHSFLTLPQTGWVKFYGMAMILPTVEGKVTSGKKL